MKQHQLIDQLIDWLQNEHGGCDQNTCDIHMSLSAGYALWAITLFVFSDAASDEFLDFYERLGPKFHRDAEAERKEFIKVTPYVKCECNAIIWEPEFCEYWCDSCGKQAKQKRGAR